jgi:hypothetical protein
MMVYAGITVYVYMCILCTRESFPCTNSMLVITSDTGVMTAGPKIGGEGGIFPRAANF